MINNKDLDILYNWFRCDCIKDYQGGPKKVSDVISRKSAWEILKYFLMECFSLYIHIFSRN